MKILFTLIALLAISIAASAQAKPSFKITPGQSVHVVVLRSTGAVDLAGETMIREEFEKRKVFKLARTEASADFSFMMVIQYEYNQVQIGAVGRGREEVKAVTAFALPKDIPDTGKADLDALRESALWQYSKNVNQWSFASLPKQFVKKFHEDMKKQP